MIDKHQIEMGCLPHALTAKHIAQILDLGEANAYRLMHSDGFPCVQVGRKLIVPKIAFMKWMENPNEYGGEKNSKKG